MNMVNRTVIAAALFWALPALGQPATSDHEAHHPDSAPTVQQPSQPAAPQAGGMGPGMMGGGTAMPGMMGQAGPASMMQMMNLMGAQLGTEHIEGRLAFIKAELKITDAQAPQWNTFADAVRANVGPMAEMRKSMMSGQSGAATLPERLAREDRLVTAHLTALKKTEEAVSKLYAVLTDDQKKAADTIVVGPMGMPMGMM